MKEMRLKQKPDFKNILTAVITVFLFISDTAFLYAQNLEDAGALEAKGDISGAVSIYESWMGKNKADRNYPSVVLHAAEIIDDQQIP